MLMCTRFYISIYHCYKNAVNLSIDLGHIDMLNAFQNGYPPMKWTSIVRLEEQK